MVTATARLGITLNTLPLLATAGVNKAEEHGLAFDDRFWDMLFFRGTCSLKLLGPKYDNNPQCYTLALHHRLTWTWTLPAVSDIESGPCCPCLKGHFGM